MLARRIDIPLLFGLWTLFVWGGRLRNLATDPGGFSEASRWSLLGSVLFTIGGLVIVVTSIAAYLGPGPIIGLKKPAVMALATLTVGVWLVRAVDIALGDHAAAFIAVHVVLALISIVLAVFSVRTVRSQMTDGSQSRRSEPGRSPVG